MTEEELEMIKNIANDAWQGRIAIDTQRDEIAKMNNDLTDMIGEQEEMENELNQMFGVR